jgi:anti-sigma28 factor (negative regulator of flagellin synthesis)
MFRRVRKDVGDDRPVESPRNERIELLREQIASGSYRVSNRRVAAAMVRHGWDVIGRSRRQG